MTGIDIVQQAAAFVVLTRQHEPGSPASCVIVIAAISMLSAGDRVAVQGRRTATYLQTHTRLPDDSYVNNLLVPTAGTPVCKDNYLSSKTWHTFPTLRP